MEAALARAEMRAKTPSTKISAKAVRSLKKKIARIVELEALRDSGKQLSPEQVNRDVTGDLSHVGVLSVISLT